MPGTSALWRWSQEDGSPKAQPSLSRHPLFFDNSCMDTNHPPHPTPVSTPHLHVLSSVVVLIHSFRFMLLAAALDDVAHVTIAT